MSDLFTKKYKKIIEPVQKNLLILDSYYTDYFSKISSTTQIKNEILPIIKEFLSEKGKRIRPALMFLLLNALNFEIKNIHYKLAMVNELIHNASLIHDDIIDCSLLRRGKKTLNFEYDSKLAVLAGDYLLTEVINLLTDIDNKEIRNLHAKSVSYLIKGELHQYFNRFKTLPAEDYIEKSKNKTARLFEAGLCGVYLYNKNQPEELENIKNFAINFGIAFQIHNDLINITDDKKLNEDIKNGDYSAPVIFYLQENPDTQKLISNNIKKSSAIKRTKELVKYFTNKAIENISFIEDNLYKQAIVELCKLYANG